MSLWAQYGKAMGEPDELTRRRLERRVLDGVETASLRRRHKRVAAVLVAAAVLAAVLLGIVLLPPGDPQPSWVAISTTTRVQQVSLPHAGALWVGVDSSVEVAASDASGAVVRLHEGDVTLHVHAGEGLRWRVEVDDYAVEAIGTRFRVQRTDAAPAVHVEEGIVRVTGPGQPEDGLLVRAVEPTAVVETSPASEAVDAPTLDDAPTLEDAAEESMLVDDADAPIVEDAGDATTPVDDPAAVAGLDAADARSPQRWVDRFRHAIASGDDAAAVAALPAGFPTGREPLSAADYLDAGDALASRRDPARAHEAYRAACRRPDVPACGVATFRRALMASRRGAPAEAIALATRYLERHPDGSLAREVLGRRMLWQSVHGDAEAAREDARTYLARWPRGPHGDLARRLLAP